MSSLPTELKNVNIPPVTFLYTLDQVAGMMNISVDKLRNEYLFYHLRTTGRRSHNQMVAINIAAPDAKPDWRVEMYEFLRWLKRMGVRVAPMVTI